MLRAVASAIALAIALAILAGRPGLSQDASPSPPAAATRPDPGMGAAGTGLAPDIIVVMVDDLAYVPNDRILERLPTINELWLEDGLRFRQMHTETPLCSPSRAALLTGQHTLQNGVITNDGDPMDPSATIATALDDAGYHTLFVGKYLNRYDGTRTPPGWDHVAMRESPVIPSYTVDGELQRYKGQHFDDVIRDQADEWLRAAPADAPVFALVTPRAPHRHPQQCTKGDRNPVGCSYLPLPMKKDRNAKACRDLRSWKPPDYATPPSDRPVPWAMPDWPKGWPLSESCESLRVIDRMVADLQAAQAERDRPAYFVFMSDNGMSWGREGYPLKHVPPSSRLPFYVAGPEIEPGVTDALVSNIDIAPTLADLAAASMPSASGTSFAPLLQGEDFEGRSELLEIMPTDPAEIYAGWAALRTPSWRYIRWDDGRVQLYNLEKDPWEEKNLARKHRSRAKRMDARLDELIAESQAAP